MESTLGVLHMKYEWRTFFPEVFLLKNFNFQLVCGEQLQVVL